MFHANHQVGTTGKVAALAGTINGWRGIKAMTRILTLGAAVFLLAQAASTVCAQQRPQGRAAQTPQELKQKFPTRSERVPFPQGREKSADDKREKGKAHSEKFPKERKLLERGAKEGKAEAGNHAKARSAVERNARDGSANNRSGKQRNAGERSAAGKVGRTTAPAPPDPPKDASPASPQPQKPKQTNPVDKPPESEVTWSNDEVLEARARCIELLAPITAEVTVSSAIRAGQCGAPAPVIVKSIGTGVRVAMMPPVTVNCRMATTLHDWLERDVQPAARDLLGEEITAVSGAVGYQCRNRSDIGRTSEHGYANALDILGFVTRNGRRISILSHWGPTERDRLDAEARASSDKLRKSITRGESSSSSRAPKEPPSTVGSSASAPIDAHDSGPAKDGDLRPEEQFLRRIHRDACSRFGTVLGPEANEEHRNHFHVDLAERGRRGNYCR